LLKASELLNCKKLLIITWDYEEELKKDNKVIKRIPLWKWLIEKVSL
jgi:predicted AAA+ superfamily ATPase